MTKNRWLWPWIQDLWRLSIRLVEHRLLVHWSLFRKFGHIRVQCYRLRRSRISWKDFSRQCCQEFLFLWLLQTFALNKWFQRHLWAQVWVDRAFLFSCCTRSPRETRLPWVHLLLVSQSRLLVVAPLLSQVRVLLSFIQVTRVVAKVSWWKVSRNTRWSGHSRR